MARKSLGLVLLQKFSIRDCNYVYDGPSWRDKNVATLSGKEGNEIIADQRYASIAHRGFVFVATLLLAACTEKAQSLQIGAAQFEAESLGQESFTGASRQIGEGDRNN